MRRYIPNFKARNDSPEDSPRPRGSFEQVRIPKPDPRYRAKHRVLVMDRNKRGPRRSWNRELKSSLLTQGKGLAQILHEVNDISKNLKLNPVDTQTLSEALHRTLLSAIKVSVLDCDLQSLALTDDLTSLYNRRAFYALATQQLRVMRRKGRGLLLFFADVNHLKEINDNYGHREGDLALVRTAVALERTFRDSDILARLSGDEFAVLALEASYQDKGAILSRLDEQLQKASAVEPRYKLSLSLGMARFDPKHVESLADLLSKADRAMYEEKRSHSRALKARS
jgi:diguanylate cyclase (GGDEF)-like protein